MKTVTSLAVCQQPLSRKQKLALTSPPDRLVEAFWQCNKKTSTSRPQGWSGGLPNGCDPTGELKVDIHLEKSCLAQRLKDNHNRRPENQADKAQQLEAYVEADQGRQGADPQA